jgi:hypothetical protein
MIPYIQIGSVERLSAFAVPYLTRGTPYTDYKSESSENSTRSRTLEGDKSGKKPPDVIKEIGPNTQNVALIHVI